MKSRLNQIWWYVLADFMAALISWFVLFLFRVYVIQDEKFNLFLPFYDRKFYVGLLIVPQIWLVLHYFSGTYTDLYRKSRLQEMIKTFIISLIGSLFIFFSLLLDDAIKKYSDYYLTFLVLFLTNFCFTFFARLFLLNRAKRKLRNKEIGFNTMVIGNNEKANDIFEDLIQSKAQTGFNFIGYIPIQELVSNSLTQTLPNLGNLTALEEIVSTHEIEEVIVAVETSEHYLLNQLLNRLADKNVFIRIIPDMYDILSGGVKMNHLSGEAFIEIKPTLLKEWERISKRWFDLILSCLALLASSPVLLYVIYKIKTTSSGPIFYKQDRLGQFGKPFPIIKFRSMYVNAEEQGPQLTSDDDPRITPIGKMIRKYRLDEFPQFWNVIKGDMSIVGPRAERKYFADLIVEKAPHFKHILKVKPGITSLGMVKYGYASTVEEMVKRLKYDIVYLENIHILMDIKILIYTVSTVIYGKGK